MAVLYHLLAARAGRPREDPARHRAAPGRRRRHRPPRRPCSSTATGSSRSAPLDAPTATPSGVDADGLIALPGLVDLHTHLREPGREDAETSPPELAAAAVGGYTAVLAMANTNPVTDTAEAAKHISTSAGRTHLVDVSRSAPSPRASPARSSPSWASWHRSRAGCGSSPTTDTASPTRRVMRRALEYVRAFGGVVSQHSQDPNLAGPQACCHEGEVSGRLGLPGGPRSPRRASSPATPCSPSTPAAGCTSRTSAPPRGSTSCGGRRRAASASPRR